MTHIIKAEWNGVPYYAETDDGQTLEECIRKIASGDIAGKPLSVIHLTYGNIVGKNMQVAEAIVSMWRRGETVCDDALEFAGDELNEDFLAEARGFILGEASE